jgi:hypothetical protein
MERWVLRVGKRLGLSCPGERIVSHVNNPFSNSDCKPKGKKVK